MADTTCKTIEVKHLITRFTNEIGGSNTLAATTALGTIASVNSFEERKVGRNNKKEKVFVIEKSLI